MAVTSAASGAGPATYRGIIPISSAPPRPERRPAALRFTAYLVVFASGAATMFAFRGAVVATSTPAAVSQDKLTERLKPVLVTPASEDQPRPLQPEPAEPKPEIQRAQPAEIPDSWSISGTLEPAPGRYARLPLATSQAVAFVDVKAGDRVQKGWQVFSHWESPERLQVAKLELAKAKKLLDVARSQAAAAEKTAARLRPLAGKVSAQELQDAETSADIRRQEVEALDLAAQESESRFAALEFEFNQAFVTSPIDGVVAAVDVALGERRQAGGPFRGVTILDPSILHCRCYLDEKQLSFIKQCTPEENRPTTVLPAVIECEGRRFAASVASIGIIADAASGLTPITFEVQNADLVLRSGAKVSVAITAPVVGDEP